MIAHLALGNTPMARSRRLYQLMQEGRISLGGYCKGKIYGTLQCASGKRMKPENRVFFECEVTALQAGYRPCGHCLSAKYKAWKRPATDQHRKRKA